MDRSSRAERMYLPLFWDLTGQTVLIVGGGKAALQKVKALAGFAVPVVVLSPAFAPGLEASTLVTLASGSWDQSFLDAEYSTGPVGLVLACTDQPAVQASVVAACRARGVPVLDAADPTSGDFVQPATARHGGFTLAVSSNGTQPRGAVAVRDALRPGFEAAVDRAVEPRS